MTLIWPTVSESMTLFYLNINANDLGDIALKVAVTLTTQK